MLSLTDLHITSVPTDPIKVALENKYYLIPFSRICISLKMAKEEVQRQIARYSFCVYSISDNNLIISYNERMPVKMIAEKVGHELGHEYYGDISKEHTTNFVMAGHLTPLGKKERKVKEILANHFAAFLTGKTDFLVRNTFVALLRKLLPLEVYCDMMIAVNKAGFSRDALDRMIKHILTENPASGLPDLGQITITSQSACITANKSNRYVCPICGLESAPCV